MTSDLSMRCFHYGFHDLSNNDYGLHKSLLRAVYTYIGTQSTHFFNIYLLYNIAFINKAFVPTLVYVLVVMDCMLGN